MKPRTWDCINGFLEHETKELALAHVTKMSDKQLLTRRRSARIDIKPFTVDMPIKVLGEKVLKI